MAQFEMIIGTTLGGAEYVADELMTALTDKDHQVIQHLDPQLADLDPKKIWFVVSSTHGAGELPDNLKPFYQELCQQQPNLREMRFAICAIGDKNYDTFCEGPEYLARIFDQQLAQLITETIKINIQDEQLPEEQALSWLNKWIDQV